VGGRGGERESEREREKRRGEERRETDLLSLSFLRMSPGFIHRGSTLMTLSNPNHLPKTPPLNTVIGLNFYPLNISQRGLDFYT
jgi:hypothetical protein